MFTNFPPQAFSEIKDFLQRPKVKKTLRILGLVLVVFGIIWSIRTLELSWRDISPKFFAIHLLILAPINLFLAAIALRINARAIACNIPVLRSLNIVVAANIAELLPLPGGALLEGSPW